MSGLGTVSQKSEHTQRLLNEFLFVLGDFIKLLDKPDELREQIRSSYQLSEEERKKSEEGRNTIQNAKHAILELSSTKKNIEDQQKLLSEQLKEQNRVLDSIKSETAKLDRLKADYAKKDTAHKEKDTQHENERKLLDKRHTDLEMRDGELRKREAVVTDTENKQKAHADRLRQAAEGL